MSVKSIFLKHVQCTYYIHSYEISCSTCIEKWFDFLGAPELSDDSQHLRNKRICEKIWSYSQDKHTRWNWKVEKHVNKQFQD